MSKDPGGAERPCRITQPRSGSGIRTLKGRRCCNGAKMRRCHRCPGQTQLEGLQSPRPARETSTERAPQRIRDEGSGQTLPHPRNAGPLSPAGPDPTARRRSPADPARCGAARGGPAPRPDRGCRARRRGSRRASGTGCGDAGPARRPRTATARRTLRSPRRHRRSPPLIRAGTRMGKERRSPRGRRASAAPPAWLRRHKPPATPHACGTGKWRRFRLRATRRRRHVTPRAGQSQRATRPGPRPAAPTRIDES